VEHDERCLLPVDLVPTVQQAGSTLQESNMQQ
jgi:hypothetical protein